MALIQNHGARVREYLLNLDNRNIFDPSPNREFLINPMLSAIVLPILIFILTSGGSPPDYYASGQGHPHSSYVAQYAQAASSYGAVSYGYSGQETK